MQISNVMNKLFITCFEIIFVLSCVSNQKKESSTNDIDLETSTYMNDIENYIACMGYGVDADQAVMHADSELASFFGKSVNESIFSSESFSSFDDLSVYKMSFEKNKEIATRVNLIALRHTSAIYDEKLKCYAVCSYINRKEAWKTLSVKLQSVTEKIENYALRTETESELFIKILLLNSLLSYSDEFYETYFFASVIYNEKVKEYSHIDSYLHIAKLELDVLKLKAPICIESTNEENSRITTKVSSLLEQSGFLISKKKSDYKAFIFIKTKVQQTTDIFISYPTISIEISGNGKTYF